MDVKSLRARARTSEDGEAYAPVASGAGFRVGVGARRESGSEAHVFVEVVLNPFPDRPHVRAEQLRTDGARVAWLESRGYRVACDADGTITCERDVAPVRVAREVDAVRKKLMT